jgi:hypothetical protein
MHAFSPLPQIAAIRAALRFLSITCRRRVPEARANQSIPISGVGENQIPQKHNLTDISMQKFC